MDRKLKSEINRLAHKAGLEYEVRVKTALLKAAHGGKTAAEIAALLDKLFPNGEEVEAWLAGLKSVADLDIPYARDVFADLKPSDAAE